MLVKPTAPQYYTCFSISEDYEIIWAEIIILHLVVYAPSIVNQGTTWQLIVIQKVTNYSILERHQTYSL